jgi:L-rhamnose 1-dehydrogenase
MLLEGKVVIITGASRGIGRAVALGCAREGADVVINDLSGPGAVVEEIRALGSRAVPAEGDVADPETSERMVAVAVDAFGKLDVLVSNAGICPFHTFLDMPPLRQDPFDAEDALCRIFIANCYGLLIGGGLI